ncbi:MAG: SHOCT domain-containing protein [Alloprevotella sp.]|nr:SHOCT domain-containing protein [Alloprevotella sp.]
MKNKFYLSSLALVLFALLGGGSFSGEDIGFFFTIILVVAGVIIVVAIIFNIVLSNNQKKRLQMIKEDEQNSTDFDRSVFIGDDRCKLYFDASKKQVMIMRVMTEGIKKEYIDDFEFPGESLATYTGPVFNTTYTSPVFNVYDPTRRKLLTGTYNDLNIIHQVTSITEKDKNKNVAVNSSIQPTFKTLRTTQTSATSSVTNRLFNVLIDESHGLMAITESGMVKDVFNYINASSLPRKKGEKSTINTREIGNYLFLMDDFFKVLVLVGPDCHESFNYSDIIEVSYEENGSQLYTKSAGRTVGGAIVGGFLMGGAGAVVGGLSGASKQNKEIRNMDIKILLRSTSRTSCVLHFKDVDRVLKTKEDADRKLYETYVKNANQAKDVLSVIIDNAKQASTPIAQPIAQPVVAPASSSVADELAKLAKLKADGILTEEEFQAQKSKLLGL